MENNFMTVEEAFEKVLKICQANLDQVKIYIDPENKDIKEIQTAIDTVQDFATNNILR